MLSLLPCATRFPITAALSVVMASHHGKCAASTRGGSALTSTQLMSAPVPAGPNTS